MAIFKLSKNLKDKLVKRVIRDTVDEEQQANDDLTRLFPNMACGDVQDLKSTLIDARTFYEPRKTAKIRSILPILIRLKNQGNLFGYPLVSDVVSHLEKIIQKSDSFSESKFNAMYNDVLLLQEILWKKIKGDGGEKGRKILNRLIRIPK